MKTPHLFWCGAGRGGLGGLEAVLRSKEIGGVLNFDVWVICDFLHLNRLRFMQGDFSVDYESVFPAHTILSLFQLKFRTV